MKGTTGALLAATTLACSTSVGAAAAGAVSPPPAAIGGGRPSAGGGGAAAAAPGRGARAAAFVGQPGLPWHHGGHRSHGPIRIAAGAGGISTSSGVIPAASRRRRRLAQAAQMRVDVEVKAPPRSSSGSEGSSGSSSGMQRHDASPPPPPPDTFRHKSLAAEPTDYGPYLKVKGYQINAFGFWFAFWSGLVWASLWAVVIVIQRALIEYLDKIDPMRWNVDFGATTWGRLSCLCTGLTPEITGLEHIPEGPCVFVANHASWMDVPYTALLPVHTKYLAKSDLVKVPVLGDAMALSNHVLLDRENKRSQMEALSSALKILKKGTPIFVFPEGTRGPQGRLQAFKMGAFKVAAKAGVPIVPVSIAGTHLIMPREVIMPQRQSNGIAAIHVHPPISSVGRTDKELATLAFDVINTALSDEQRSLRPYGKKEKDEEGSSGAASSPM